jgi:hypothetical protein
VFVVSVAQPEANIKTNMNLNAYWAQDGTAKTEGIAIDAEHDVLYYEASKGGYDYTFKPEGVSSVLLAQPAYTGSTTEPINGHSPAPDGKNLQYTGFSTNGVTAHSDGSYSVRLGFGRNIVKLVSTTGAEYQVITAKPVTYTVQNVTHPDEDFLPGDSLLVTFNTLYHPSNKMSGIYNMSAGIQYTGFMTNFALILGPGQYTFASRAQSYKTKIPDTATGKEFTLTSGVIKTKGFGSYYGEHRNITQQNGVTPNLSASIREAYFGSLPEIHIRMKGNVSDIADVNGAQVSVYPNPFTDYIVIEAATAGEAIFYDLSGKTALRVTLKTGSNTVSTSSLIKGVYILKYDTSSRKIIK